MESDSVDEMNQAKSKALRIADACIKLAARLQAGRARIGQFGRSYAFRDTGRACCPFGHAIAIAGLAPKAKECRSDGILLPYEGNVSSFVSSVWGAGRFHFPLGQKLLDALTDLELANDVLVGQARRDGIHDNLIKVAKAIQEQFNA